MGSGLVRAARASETKSFLNCLENLSGPQGRVHAMDRPNLTFAIAQNTGLEFVFSSGNAVRYPVHTHRSVHTVTLVRQGFAAVQRKGGLRTFHAGQLYVDAPYEPHSPSYSDAYDIVSLCIDKRHLRNMEPGLLLRTCAGYLRSFSGRQAISPEHRGLLLETVAELRQASYEGPSTEAPDAVAYSRRVSRSHFLRRFKRETGLTPHQHLMQQRLRTAKRLLTSGHSIADAAILAGFYDQSHLNRWFAKNLGITPYAYRNACLFLD